MIEIGWTSYSSVNTALSTELNSLPNDGLAISSSIDGATLKDLFMDIELYLGSIDLSAQTNPSVYLWLRYSFDGATFEDGDASTEPSDSPISIIPCRLGTGAMTQRLWAKSIVVPPTYFKILLQNKTGVAFAASGNTLKYVTYRKGIYYV